MSPSIVPSHGTTRPADFSGVWATARAAVQALAARMPPPRPERLSGIHNPWGAAATQTNAWAFLDLCEHPRVVERVAALIGNDVILWDSELHLAAGRYRDFVAAGREGRYWPVDALAGAIVAIPFGAIATDTEFDVREVSEPFTATHDDEPLYIVRYMPAAHRFVREPTFIANRRCMEEQPLINYENRPLWLVRGEDRAGNDFVTGFATAAPRWANQ